MAVRVDRKDVCKEASETLALGGEGEKRVHDDLQLLNLHDWEMGSPHDSSREVGKSSWLEGEKRDKMASSTVDKLGFQRWRVVWGEEASRQRETWALGLGNAQPEIPRIWFSCKNKEILFDKCKYVLELRTVTN